NFFDTAEIYGDGVSETVLGKGLKEIRDNVVIATKVSPSHLRYKDVLKACENSLKRLNTDRIDLYQIHWPNFYIPLKETAQAMDELYKQGKIKAVGVSNFPVPMIKEFKKNLKVAPLVSNQVQYNLVERLVEKEIAKYCRRNGMSIIAYSPLAQGLLTGKYSSSNIPTDAIRRNKAWFRKENLDKIMNLLRELESLSNKYNKKISQISLNWLISHPNTIAIPGAKTLEQLKENVESCDFELSKSDFKYISRISENLDLDYF
ncbi:MAG TPA: aldo/keto reductase, partial [Geobacterales bacterium]|nr:aldo/keto reductase [Geobacterales bacterium]